MKKMSEVPGTIDEYIAAFPSRVQSRLQTIRKIIRKVAPQAEERISYRIPAFAFHGNLMYFAAYKSHIGIYPGAAAVEAFSADLTGYQTSKGTVQLPLDRPLPAALITKLVRFNLERNSRKKKR